MGATLAVKRPETSAVGRKNWQKSPKTEKLSVKIFPLENVSFVSFWVNGNRKMAKIWTVGRKSHHLLRPSG